MRPKPALYLTLPLLAAAGALPGRPGIRRAGADVPSALARPAAQFRIVLGASDTAPRDWSGGLSVSGSGSVRVRPWHFDSRDTLTGAVWQARTLPFNRPRRPFEAHLQDTGGRWFNRPGLLVETSSDPGTEVRVHTANGDFSFRVEDLPMGLTRAYLGGGAAVQRVPLAEVLPPDEGQSDYPALGVAPDGTAWVSWQEYRELKDRLYVRRMANGARGGRMPVPGAEGDLYGSAVALDARGRLWVVWAAQVDGNYDLYAAVWDGRGWSRTERLTADAAPDVYHRMAADRQGRLTLVWQGFRGGQSDILTRRFDGQRWSPERRVSTSPANDWQPAVSVGADGHAVVAWDTYDRGNYDVVTRRIDPSGNPSGPVTPVAAAPNFEAHAAVTIDGDNRTWVAYDVSGPNWGKDTGFEWERSGKHEGTRLYRWRAVEVQVDDGGGFRRVASPDKLLTNNFSEGNELPALATDSEGRVWCFLRHRTMKDLSLRGIGRGRNWEWYATTISGARWLPAIYLPDSDGRNDMRAAPAADRGRMVVAYVTDNRPWAAPAPQHLDIVVAAIPHPADRLQAALPSAGPAPLPPGGPPAGQDPTPVHPDEAARVRRMRQAAIRAGGETLHIYRGDMHRHTDISSDGGGDGPLADTYRYALDAAAFDYIAITDHQAGDGNEYAWWCGQKLADVFHVPGAFTPLFAYERSLPYPNGHRNVVHAQRGVRVLPFAPGENQGRVNSGPVLYPHLRETNGIAMSHTSATGMGTDWRDNDPKLEPLVEIFQGDRNSYEYQGAPHSSDPADTATQEGGYRPAGFVWNALAKGCRLGFQASSDHLSTHVSYGCLLAPNSTREALLEAIRKRRAYAATDNILLDVRLRDGDREHVMGEETEVRSRPALRIRIAGTGPLQEVAIVRSNKVVFTGQPKGSSYRLDYTDAEAAPGASAYYYVRVLQRDGQTAWGSPIWVRWREP